VITLSISRCAHLNYNVMGPRHPGGFGSLSRHAELAPPGTVRNAINARGRFRTLPAHDQAAF